MWGRQGWGNFGGRVCFDLQGDINVCGEVFILFGRF